MRYLPFIIISLILYTWFFYNNQQPDLLTVNNVSDETIINEKIVTLDFIKTKQEQTSQLTNTPKVTEITSASKVTKIEKTVPEITNPKVTKPESIEPEVIVSEIIVPKKTLGSELVAGEIKTDEVKKVEVKTAQEVPTKIIETSMPTSSVEPTPLKEIASEKELPTPASRKKEDGASNPEKKEAIVKQIQASRKQMPASEAALIKGEFYDNNFYLTLDPAPKRKPKKKTEPVKKSTTKPVTEVVQSSPNNKPLKQTKSTATPPPASTATTKKMVKPKRTFKKVDTPLAAPAGKGLQEAIAVSGGHPNYPKKAKNEKLQGSVTVKFTVNMQGKTKSPKIISSSGHKTLDAAVLSFIKQERFMPAFDGTEVVTKEQQLTHKFSLK